MSDNKKSLNQKIEELDKNMEWFYSDDFNLDVAVEKYEKTLKMAKEVNGDLVKMKNKIEILSEDFSK